MCICLFHNGCLGVGATQTTKQLEVLSNGFHHQSEFNRLNNKELTISLFEHVVADVSQIFTVKPHLDCHNEAD